MLWVSVKVLICHQSRCKVYNWSRHLHGCQVCPRHCLCGGVCLHCCRMMTRMSVQQPPTSSPCQRLFSVQVHTDCWDIGLKAVWSIIQYVIQLSPNVPWLPASSTLFSFCGNEYSQTPTKMANANYFLHFPCWYEGLQDPFRAHLWRFSMCVWTTAASVRRQHKVGWFLNYFIESGGI